MLLCFDLELIVPNGRPINRWQIDFQVLCIITYMCRFLARSISSSLIHSPTNCFSVQINRLANRAYTVCTKKHYIFVIRGRFSVHATPFKFPLLFLSHVSAFFQWNYFLLDRMECMQAGSTHVHRYTCFSWNFAATFQKTIRFLLFLSVHQSIGLKNNSCFFYLVCTLHIAHQIELLKSINNTLFRLYLSNNIFIEIYLNGWCIHSPIVDFNWIWVPRLIYTHISANLFSLIFAGGCFAVQRECHNKIARMNKVNEKKISNSSFAIFCSQRETWKLFLLYCWKSMRTK